MPHISKELSFLEFIYGLKGLPKGIIHGDAFQDNIFFKNDKLSGLIDFYFACNDFYAYDLAISQLMPGVLTSKLLILKKINLLILNSKDMKIYGN